MWFPPAAAQQFTQSFTAALSFVGVFGPTKTFKVLAATFSDSASLLKKIIDSGFTATLSFVGSLTKKLIDSGFTATLSFAGNLQKQAGKSLTASLSFAGAISRR